MIESMTGFIRRSIDIAFGDVGHEKKLPLVVEIKSLNSRYFEASFRLPLSLQHLELSMMPLLKKGLMRGRVFCTIKSESTEGVLETYEPVHSVIEQYVGISKNIASKYGIPDDLSVAKVLGAPGAFVPVSLEMNEDQERAFLVQIQEVTKGLVVARRAEGTFLEKDLLERLAVCSDRIALIKQAFGDFFESKKLELAKYNDLCADQENVAKDPSLTLKLDELSSVVHKGDIHEELVRFAAHIAAFEKLVRSNSDEEKGRRFEFTLQEMHREINTVMAKSSVAEISNAGIDIKCELEKMREQIQNVV